MLQGIIKQFITPAALEKHLQTLKESAAVLHAQAGAKLMATLEQDPETGAFVMGLFRHDTAGNWQLHTSKTISNGADMADLLKLLTTAFSDAPQHPTPQLFSQQQPAAITQQPAADWTGSGDTEPHPHTAATTGATATAAEPAE